MIKKRNKINGESSIADILTFLEGRVYTTRGLMNYLNNKYGGKKTQRPFKHCDVREYALRGALPVEYGGNKIRIISNNKIGIELYEIEE